MAAFSPSTRQPAVPVRRSVHAFGPNWYAAVMGTAIVAVAGSALRLRAPGLHALLLGVWALSALVLAAVLAGRAAHWLRHGEQARAQLQDPAVAPFYGCLSMAVLAVGGGALATHAPGGVRIDAVLWTVGTVLALAVAAGVPYLLTVREDVGPGHASPVWLLPLVAPMVAAALGPPLAARLPAGQARWGMLLGSYALFGMSLFGTLLVLPPVFSRLMRRGAPPLALTPALFLVLGPLGQSTTAVGNLADAAPGAFTAAAVLYGVPVLGFALLWLGLAAALVLRAVRRGMGFSMTWWSFTFPVGTCVTGAAGLARHAHLTALHWLAVFLYGVLVAAWLVASAGTARGVLSGALLPAPPPAPAAPR